jgi:hypothetical protein
VGQLKELKLGHFMFFVVYQRAYNAKSKMGVWHINIVGIHYFFAIYHTNIPPKFWLVPNILQCLRDVLCYRRLYPFFSSSTFLDLVSFFMNLQRQKFI